MYPSIAQLMGAVAIAPPGKLYGIMPGDSVRVTARIDYKGPALTDYFYAAIGEFRGITWPLDIGLFDEIWHETSSGISFGPSTVFETYDLEVDIPITEIGVFPWTPGWFDIYAKIVNTRVFSPRYNDVIEVLLAPEFQDFAITDYSKAP
ncbi:hypothetical protein ES706_06050 [subsurface metagenome]